MSKRTAGARTPAKKPAARANVTKPLSPRGRGSVAASDTDRLLNLFAENMRRVRLARELSQEALADLCDLDRTYVSSVERKRRNLSIRNIQRIADALSVDARDLLNPDLAADPRFGVPTAPVGAPKPPVGAPPERPVDLRAK